jgi:hypothetical protein
MKRLLTTSFLIAAIFISGTIQAAVTRFDSVYFFQSEDALLKKKVVFKDVARFSRQMKSRVWNVLKKVDIKPTNGYLVVAVRSDGQIMAWLDMQPILHEYYDYEIVESIRKMQPFNVEFGMVVFGIKMAVETAVHTKKEIPEPPSWKMAKKKLSNPNDIEELMFAIWPEDE